MTAPSKRTQQIRDQIDHPVIDADGHTLEYLPAVREHMRDVGGQGLVDAFRTGRLPDPMNGIRYYNIRTMQACDLS